MFDSLFEGLVKGFVKCRWGDGEERAQVAPWTSRPSRLTTEDGANQMMVTDGHVHITNRVYWEQIDPWQPQAFGSSLASTSLTNTPLIY
jgi:hypothetical protein